MRENHDKADVAPDFLRRSTGREQLCATFFTESRMYSRFHQPLQEMFGLHQLRNCSRRPRLARKDVCPLALVLNFRGVRSPFDNLFNLQARSFHVPPDCGRLEEEELHRHRLSPHLLYLDNLISYMKCEQQQSTWSQHSMHFLGRRQAEILQED